MAATLVETFTSANGVNPTSRNSDSGHTWTAAAGTWVVQGNRAANTGSPGQLVSNYVPASANQIIQMTVRSLTVVAGQNFWAIGRYVDSSNYYQAGYNSTTSQWAVGKTVAGTFTILNGVVESLVTNGLYVVRLEINGSDLKLYVNDVLKAQATDTSLTAVGSIAIRSSGTSATTSTGTHLTDVAADIYSVAITESLNDTFTAADGTAMSAHNADSGQGWYTRTGTWTIQNNRMINTGVAGEIMSNTLFRNINNYVQGTFRYLSDVATQELLLMSRSYDPNNGYCGGYSQVSSTLGVKSWVIGKKGASDTYTELAAVAVTPTVGNDYNVRLECDSSTITLFVNNTIVLSVVDATNSTVGGCGVKTRGTAVTSTTGMQLSDFTAGAFPLSINNYEQNRIFQRNIGTLLGDLTISGKYSNVSVPTTVEARVMQGTTVIKDWTALSGIVISAGTFTGQLTNVTQGDGYSLKIRSKDGSGTVLNTRDGSTTWGIGKLFAVFGSSTAQKWFLDSTVEVPSSYTRRYNGAWNPMAGSAAIAFCNKALTDEPNVPIGLLDSGIGGTTLAQWYLNTDANFVGLKVAITAVGGKLEGGIVHVGSNDARNEAIVSQSQHETRYRAMLSNLRTHCAQPTLPVFIMGCTRAPLEPSTSNQQWTWARAAEIAVAADAYNFMGSSVEDLPLNADNVHLSDLSAGVSGRRVAQCYETNFLNTGEPYRGPQPTYATYNSTTGKVIVTFSLNGGTSLVGKTANTGLTGFRVSDDGFTTLKTISSAVVATNTTVELTVPTGLSGVQVDYLTGTNPNVSNCLYNNASAPSIGGLGSDGPLSIGGVAIGAVGTSGIYTGFTLSTGDEFTVLDIIGPAQVKGYTTTRAAFDHIGARGSSTSTNYYADPKTTGYKDLGRGVAQAWDNISITGSTRLKLRARKMTTPEQALTSPTTITSNVREILAAGISTALKSGFYVGSIYDVIVEAMVRHKAKASAPRGAHATIPWVYGAAPTRGGLAGDEWDLNEGSSQAAYLEQNVWTAGTPANNNRGGPFDKFDGTDHLWSLHMSKNGTFAKLYIDGTLVATASVDPNSKSKPQFVIFTVVSLFTSFKGESYVSADWDTQDMWIEMDYYRIWRKTGANHYVPLLTVADRNVTYNSTASIVLPSKTAIWGNGSVTEFVQCVATEANAPGNVDDLAFDTFPAGITYDSTTRTISIDWSTDTTGAGRIHVTVSAWDTTGSTYEPLVFAINRGPNLPVSITLPTTGTFDLYAACDCGILTSNTSGTKAKTITVNSGMPTNCSYSDTTGLITTTGATSGSATLNITVINSIGQTATGNIDVLITNLEAETTALIARFPTAPTSGRTVTINNLIASLKTGAISGSNIWNKLDALYIFAASDAEAARLNWIANTRNCTRVQPTTAIGFTADSGFTTNGTDNYLDTNHNPNTGGGTWKFQQNTASLSVWCGTSGQDTNLTAGAFITSAGSTTINARSTTDTATWRVNQANFDTVSSITNGVGFYSANRTTSSATQLYKNGSSIGTGTQTSTTMVNDTFKFGRATTAGFSARLYQAGHFGQSLTANEQTDLYNAIRTYMTAVGVP